FCYLLFEPIFSWLFIPDSLIVDKYEQLFSIGIFCFILFQFQRLEKFEKVYIGIFTILFVKLILVSLSLFGSVFEYFYLYIVIFPVVYTIFIKFLFKKLDIDILEFLCKFYLC